MSLKLLLKPPDIIGNASNPSEIPLKLAWKPLKPLKTAWNALIRLETPCIFSEISLSRPLTFRKFYWSSSLKSRDIHWNVLKPLCTSIPEVGWGPLKIHWKSPKYPQKSLKRLEMLPKHLWTLLKHSWKPLRPPDTLWNASNFFRNSLETILKTP